MLTAILTHHLGWVGTVAPLSLHTNLSTNIANPSSQAADQSPSSPASNPYLTTNLARLEKAKMSEISKFHPYNVLWAQMSDLYGAIGNPPKLSKTIVCGSQEPLIDKVLNVLTYFIRCGQIERDVRAEVFDKFVVEDILSDFSSVGKDQSVPNQDTVTQTAPTLERSSMRRSGKGMARSATCLKDLTTMMAEEDDAYSSMPLQTSKKNDIPNVIIFRDSRFVKQELRIGNHLMDTGIEMTMKQRSDIRDYRVKQQSELGNIRLLVTSPDMEESTVNDAASNSTDDTVEEVTENFLADSETVPKGNLKTSPSLSDLITANSLGYGSVEGTNCVDVEPSGLLWGIEPIKESVSIELMQHIEKGEALNLKNGNYVSADDLKRSKSLFTKSSGLKNPGYLRRTRLVQHKSINEVDSWDSDSLDEDHTIDDMENMDPAPNSNLKAYPSLSDLITANSCGASDRLTWGIELVKEGVTLDEVQHFQNSQKRIEDNSRKDPGVVFVLGGDNESLTNLKLSSYIKGEEPSRKPISAIDKNTSSSSKLPASSQTIPPTRKTCSHKKHSGVKFNFEKYPQIATNYMKNKNIDLTHYDFIEKGHKLDEESLCTTAVPSDFPTSGLETEDSENSECECCAGNATRLLLQTPSNATELDFNNDDNNYPTSTKAASTSTLTSAPAMCSSIVLTPKPTDTESIADTKIKLITLPLSQCVLKAEEPTHKSGHKLDKGMFGTKPRKLQRPGFIPSLFVGITDHFIADMVLQVSWISKIFFFL